MSVKIACRMYFYAALSVMLTGTLATHANAQTGAPPQSPIPPAVAKDCAARILNDSPKVKFVGSFARMAPAGTFGREIYLARRLTIAAPTRTPGFMDQIVKHSKGCIYDITDGKPVFERLIPEISLPRRKLLPGEK